jgi:hypothetical protein
LWHIADYFSRLAECLLSGVKRTLFPTQADKSANDPEQTQGRIRSPTAFEGCAALQLQMIAPSSPLSHSASDLQLSEFFISVQSFAPIQAHLDPSPGVSKQLNSAVASQLQPSDANVTVTTRTATLMAPLTDKNFSR